MIRRFKNWESHRGISYHFDGVAGALFKTDRTAGTGIVVEFVLISRSQFYNGIFRAGSVAAVALKAITAGKTAHGFVAGFFFRKPGYYFAKVPGSLLHLRFGLDSVGGIGLIPQM